MAFALLPCHTTAQTLSDIRALRLPVLEVTTVNGEEPTCDFVYPPEGGTGYSITNATKVPSRLVMTQSGNTLFDTGDYAKGESGMTIKIAGNTSAYFGKPSYKLKLQKKADLLLRGDKRYKDKEWRLLPAAHNLNTLIGFRVNALMGLQWTPQIKFCNLVINDTYKGTYMIAECVERNPDCRLDVSDTGYIIERDLYWWNEDVYFESTMMTRPSFGFTFKYPDTEDLQEAQIDYIRDYVCQAEAAITAGNYDMYIDVASFAAWLLAHDILGTWDSPGSNLYLTKYDSTPQSRLTAGNLWDFDSIFQNGEEAFAGIHYYHFWFQALFASKNNAFLTAYVQQWQQVSPTLEADIMDYLYDFAASDEGIALQQSREFNHEGSVEADLQTAKAWLDAHLPWLGEAITAQTPSGCHDIALPLGQMTIYDLSGRKVGTQPQHGLYITHGKKVIK